MAYTSIHDSSGMLAGSYSLLDCVAVVKEEVGLG